MSEYQYYEFQAIDRPLTREEMAELRAISSRAAITPTRFTNFYTFGSFKGDPTTLLERYFDAHVYVANWGRRVLSFAMPRAAVDPAALRAYQAEGSFSLAVRRERVILTFESQDESGSHWVEDDEGSGWMGSLVPLRADIMTGDLRAPYLGWLRGLQAGGIDDDADGGDDVEEDDLEPWFAGDVEPMPSSHVEPPVPPGLGTVTAPLESLIDFLGLDRDLVAVAGERSGPISENAPTAAALAGWVASLTVREKDQLLVRLLLGETGVTAELLRRYRAATAARREHLPAGERRTVGELLRAARERSGRRRRAEAEAAARARNAYLDELASREEAVWQEIDALAETKQGSSYARAAELVADLRDLAERDGRRAELAARLSALRRRHARKTGLLQRIDRLMATDRPGSRPRR